MFSNFRINDVFFRDLYNLKQKVQKCWAGKCNNRECTRHHCTKTLLNICVGLWIGTSLQKTSVFSRWWFTYILETLKWLWDHTVRSVSSSSVVLLLFMLGCLSKTLTWFKWIFFPKVRWVMGVGFFFSLKLTFNCFVWYWLNWSLKID